MKTKAKNGIKEQTKRCFHEAAGTIRGLIGKRDWRSRKEPRTPPLRPKGWGEKGRNIPQGGGNGNGNGEERTIAASTRYEGPSLLEKLKFVYNHILDEGIAKQTRRYYAMKKKATTFSGDTGPGGAGTATTRTTPAMKAQKKRMEYEAGRGRQRARAGWSRQQHTAGAAMGGSHADLLASKKKYGEQSPQVRGGAAIGTEKAVSKGKSKFGKWKKKGAWRAQETETRGMEKAWDKEAERERLDVMPGQRGRRGKYWKERAHKPVRGHDAEEEKRRRDWERRGSPGSEGHWSHTTGLEPGEIAPNKRKRSEDAR